MNVQLSKLDLSTKILVLINLYHKNLFPAAPNKSGVRSGDLFFILHKEEVDENISPANQTNKDMMKACLNQMVKKGIVSFDKESDSDPYYYISTTFLS